MTMGLEGVHVDAGDIDGCINSIVAQYLYLDLEKIFVGIVNFREA